MRLTDDEALRTKLGETGKKRAANQLRWDDERARLMAAYAKAMQMRHGDRRMHALEKKLKPST